MYNLLISEKKIINLKPNGEPRTSAIDAMIVLIKKLVTDNCRLTVRQIAKLLVVELSSGTVYAAIIEYLKLKRPYARCILTKEQKRQCVRISKKN